MIKLLKRKDQEKDVYFSFNAEKEQTNTLIGIIFILAIAVAVGTIFRAELPEIGQTVVNTINEQFSRIGADE